MAAERWNEVSPEIAGWIEAALSGGNKIEAIKIYRDATGAGLKEAKDAIEGTAPPSVTRATGHSTNWPGVSNEASAKIDAAIAAGDRIGAIRLYRQATGCELIDAKQAIDRGLPPNFVARSSPLRALVTFALVIIVILFVAYFRKQ